MVIPLLPLFDTRFPVTFTVSELYACIPCVVELLITLLSILTLLEVCACIPIAFAPLMRLPIISAFDDECTLIPTSPLSVTVLSVILLISFPEYLLLYTRIPIPTGKVIVLPFISARLALTLIPFEPALLIRFSFNTAFDLFLIIIP